MKKISIEEIKRRFDSEPIDYTNTSKLAEDCWLFLTDHRLPARANIKKEAFIHEVKVMIESAILFNKPKKVYAIYTGCKFEGGGVDKLFVDKSMAIQAATLLFKEKQKETERIYGKESEDYDEGLYNDFLWKQENETSWGNSVDVISVIEYIINHELVNSEHELKRSVATEDAQRTEP